MYWRGIKATLKQRGLLRQFKRLQDGQRIPLVPQTHAIVAPEWVAFVLDMHRLGGVSREQWLDTDLWAQVRATLQGRRVFVADSAGLALVVARQPGQPRRKRLPASLVMTPDATPPGDYTVLLGESASGDVLLDLSEGERAILVGGTTGCGKTRTIVSWVLQLARKHGPDQLSLALIDLKRLDFTALAGLPHLVRPVATTESDAVDLVEWCVQEMERRQVVMQAAQVTRWDRLPIENGERFPLLVLVVDECADFATSDVMGNLVELARKSRASGIAIVAATQRPDANVLNPQVKANLTTRIAFRVASHYDSKIILDRAGAERIKRTGLALTNAGGQWRKVQTAYVPDEATGEWVSLAPTGPVLSDVERALVRYAVEELGGAFVTDRLYNAQERGDVATDDRLSKYALVRLARAWELRGWLTEPGRDDNGHKTGRLVTPELANLAVTRLELLQHATTRHNTHNTITRSGAQGVELPAFLAERQRGADAHKPHIPREQMTFSKD